MLASETIRVYKFYSAKWGRSALKHRRLKVSPVDDLNDPFEYLSVNIGDKILRSEILQIRKSIGKYGAIISFSESWSSPVIWSHYADNHKGMALGFDIPKKSLFKMKYTDNKLEVSRDSIENLQIQKKIVDHISITKSLHWQYEKEWRLFFNTKHVNSNYLNDEIAFQPFCKEIELREIILGCRYTSKSKATLEAKLNKEGISIKIARPAFESFKMVTQLSSNLQTML